MRLPFPSTAVARTAAIGLTVLALAATGCFDSIGVTCPGNAETCFEPDFSTGRDLATPADPATADLLVPDLAAPDLAAPDLAVPDLAHPLDLATPKDLTPSPDLARDFKDLSVAADLSVADLSVPADLSLVITKDLIAVPIDLIALDGPFAVCLQTCAVGCCTSTGQCNAGIELTACGRNGGTCLDCSILGDACDPNGQCRCGTSNACQAGQHCVLGRCECGSVSCPLGCCDNNQRCVGFDQQSPSQCGKLGGSCVQCLNNQACTTGSCL